MKERKNAELKQKVNQSKMNINSKLNLDIKKLKSSMDKIIIDLSRETNPQNLNSVAKDLLKLHRFIDILNLNYSIENTKENDYIQPTDCPVFKRPSKRLKNKKFSSTLY